MKLKIIIFPFVLIMTVILSINFIYPDYQSAQKIRAEIEAKKKTLEDLESKSGNVKKLIEDLDNNEEKKNLVMKYLPEKKNEEVVVDRSNFITIDSAVNLALVDFSEVASPVVQQLAPEEQAIQDRNSIFTDTGDPAAIPEPKVLVNKFGTKIEFVGAYQNIRRYIERIYGIENWFEIKKLEIAIQENEEENSEANEEESDQPLDSAVNALEAVYELDFGYLPKSTIKMSYIPSVFSKSEFDFSAADKIRNMSTTFIPEIDAGIYGNREDPFSFSQ